MYTHIQIQATAFHLLLLSTLPTVIPVYAYACKPVLLEHVHVQGNVSLRVYVRVHVHGHWYQQTYTYVCVCVLGVVQCNVVHALVRVHVHGHSYF